MSSILPPVVLIIFNRPELTQRIVETILDMQPRQLFIIADGPRPDNLEDAEACKATRAVVDDANWKYQVFKNYADQNLGCKQRIYTGLNWVFEQVDSAVILEDDCLPDPSFFRFCSELLLKYKDDERIFTISGNNFQFGRQRTSNSYYFSRYPHCWGWATWKRAWRHCNIQMTTWPTVRDQDWLYQFLESKTAARYWRHKFQQCYEERINTWDYPWLLSYWLKDGLSILPNHNLVSNIGFSVEGTHHRNNKTIFANMPTIPMRFPLQHPAFIERHSEADAFTQEHQFGLPARMRRKVLSLLP